MIGRKEEEEEVTNQSHHLEEVERKAFPLNVFSFLKKTFISFTGATVENRDNFNSRKVLLPFFW